MDKVIKKPWGKEVFLEVNKKYMFKKLYMKKGHRCSLQFHKKKKRNYLCAKRSSANNLGQKN
jgi:mannose-6-phosphate isomerase-like protein (cupin superfamily)